jgi:hypothetical protein
VILFAVENLQAFGEVFAIVYFANVGVSFAGGADLDPLLVRLAHDGVGEEGFMGEGGVVEGGVVGAGETDLFGGLLGSSVAGSAQGEAPGAGEFGRAEDEDFIVGGVFELEAGREDGLGRFPIHGPRYLFGELHLGFGIFAVGNGKIVFVVKESAVTLGYWVRFGGGLHLHMQVVEAGGDAALHIPIAIGLGRERETQSG